MGFPGEAEEDFNITYDFIRENNFSRLHVFKYSPRPGTKAASMPGHIPAEQLKSRSLKLRKLDAELQLKFLKRFDNCIRPAVLEGSKGTVITDNYIRLELAIKEGCKIPKTHTIFNVKVCEVSGKG